jgi:regulator of replication initiation timing
MKRRSFGELMDSFVRLKPVRTQLSPDLMSCFGAFLSVISVELDSLMEENSKLNSRVGQLERRLSNAKINRREPEKE